MQTEADKQRLLARYGQTPVSARALIAKCAAGLLILLGLLLLGVYVQAGSTGTLAVAAHAGHERESAVAANDQRPPNGAADPLSTRLGVCIGRSYSVVPAHRLPVGDLVADAHLHCQVL